MRLCLPRWQTFSLITVLINECNLLSAHFQADARQRVDEVFL